MKWYKAAALVVGAWISACGIAAAEFTSWESSSYPFANVKSIYVAEMDTRDVALPQVKAQKVKSILDNKLQKLSLPSSLTLTSGFGMVPYLSSAAVPKASEAYADPEDTFALAQESGADVYIIPRLTHWLVDSYLIPAHVEWRTRQVKDGWRDENGNWHESYHTEEYPEYIPDRYVPYAEVTVTFDWYDRESGQLIASSEDERQRDVEDNPQGIYERIVDRFVKNLKKTVKR